MAKFSTRERNPEFAPSQLVPNLVTLGAICAGLSAIRIGINGDYTVAVLLLLLAAALVGLDGRIARKLGSESRLGPELDSLADFLNFGVAPPIILYYWALIDMKSAAWLAVLAFAVCCVLRLARFNADCHDEPRPGRAGFFVGVPAPAGGILALLPMYVSFSFPDPLALPGALVCAWMILIGLLMVSRIPTWSFKSARVTRRNVILVAPVVAGVVAALLSNLWITLAVLCVAYVAVVGWITLFRMQDEA